MPRWPAQEIFRGFEEEILKLDKEKLVYLFNEVLNAYVAANTFSYSQPIELRFQELIAGVRAEIEISLYGPDLEVVKQKGDEIVQAASRVPRAADTTAVNIWLHRGAYAKKTIPCQYVSGGASIHLPAPPFVPKLVKTHATIGLNVYSSAADTRAQMIPGLPNLRVRVDHEAIARYGINAGDVLDAVEAIGGHVVGQVVEEQPRFGAFQVVESAPAGPFWRFGSVACGGLAGFGSLDGDCRLYTICALCLRKVFNQLTDADIECLNVTLQRLKTACEKKDLAGGVRHDMALHRFLIERTGNADLMAIWLPVVSRMFLHYSRHRNMMESYQEHAAIVEAIRKKDRKAAIKALIANIQ